MIIGQKLNEWINVAKCWRISNSSVSKRLRFLFCETCHNISMYKSYICGYKFFLKTPLKTTVKHHAHSLSPELGLSAVAFCCFSLSNKIQVEWIYLLVLLHATNQWTSLKVINYRRLKQNDVRWQKVFRACVHACKFSLFYPQQKKQRNTSYFVGNGLYSEWNGPHLFVSMFFVNVLFFFFEEKPTHFISWPCIRLEIYWCNRVSQWIQNFESIFYLLFLFSLFFSPLFNSKVSS